MNPHPIDLDAVLRTRPLRGETIVWTGAPDASEMARQPPTVVTVTPTGNGAVRAYKLWALPDAESVAAQLRQLVGSER
ncbi:MAG: hypothetical protein P4L33_21700 [Capsulimonadaceae bacterium]|nr:hypothetical protein [Capsulimonadaceae bacterium]